MVLNPNHSWTQWADVPINNLKKKASTVTRGIFLQVKFGFLHSFHHKRQTHKLQKCFYFKSKYQADTCLTTYKVELKELKLALPCMPPGQA